MPKSSTFRADMSDSIRASHILLMYAGSSGSSAARTKEDASSKINELLAELQAGGDFAALAKAHSDCPSSAKGGDLSQFGRGQMVKPFEDAAFALGVGETSEVVETDFGFHLIQRTG